MKITKLLGERFKETPSDCQIESHALMMRGGYMKYVANGIFSSYMPLKRITRKIEQILREERREEGKEGRSETEQDLVKSSWEQKGFLDFSIFPCHLSFCRISMIPFKLKHFAGAT